MTDPRPTIFPEGFGSPRGPRIAFGEGSFVSVPLPPLPSVHGKAMVTTYPGGLTYYDDSPPYDENAGIPCGTE